MKAVFPVALLTALVAAPAMAQESRSTASPSLALSIASAVDAAASTLAADDQTPAAPAAAPDTPPAPDSAAQTAAFFKETEVSGFVDMYYGYNFNKVNPQLRNFDVTHNSFSLNLAEVALEKKPTSDSRSGFRIDLDYGPTAAIVAGSEGNAASTTIFQNVQQAYVSYLAPTGTGLQIDAGKFVTPAGYEVIESKDNWNYSRSLLFALAIPYDHMGVRVSYSPTDKVTLAGYVVNGWNNSVDNNTGKTVIGSVTFKPTGAFTFIENYIGGTEATAPASGMRNLSDTVLTYTATKAVSLAGNFDYGKDSATSQTWWGGAAYLRYQVNDVVAITPRFEYLNDKDGFMTGVSQKPMEGTVTLEFKDKSGVTLRAEYRHDMSDQSFFTKDTGATSKSQDTVTAGLIYAFSTKNP
jgi:hypothetical protein